jgi:hypothetical protein
VALIEELLSTIPTDVVCNMLWIRGEDGYADSVDRCRDQHVSSCPPIGAMSGWSGPYWAFIVLCSAERILRVVPQLVADGHPAYS